MRRSPVLIAFLCVLSLNGCAGEAESSPREVDAATEFGAEAATPLTAVPAVGEMQRSVTTDLELERAVPASGGLLPYPGAGPDLDCPDIRAAVRVDGRDPHRLDRDRDGIGCEEYL